MKYIYKINMVLCDAKYRLKAGDQVFVSAPRLGPKLRYPTHWALGSVANRLIGEVVQSRRRPSWLKAPTSAFTFKTLLRHYAKQTLTPR